METYPPLSVLAWGEYACFTRPEFKVERVSYEVMTPSAARGVLEAIFWKPEFRWQVRTIKVLKPPRHASILRNEVSSRMSERAGSIDINDSKNRAQRHSLVLRDVAYIIEADVKVKVGVGEDPAKFRDQFRRRVKRGQCFHRPYLGCREFAAQFREPEESDQPVAITDELGRMLHDVVFTPKAKDARVCDATPVFFNARLEDGVLHVPPLPEVTT